MCSYVICMEKDNIDSKTLFWYSIDVILEKKVHYDIESNEVITDNIQGYYVKIVDDENNEYFSSRVLSDAEFKTFKKIMISDKDALLNIRHEKLGDSAKIKIKYRNNIKNLLNYNNVKLENLINKFNNLKLQQ